MIYSFSKRGNVDDFSLVDYSSPFCFLLIELHRTFSIPFKMLPYYVYYCILFRSVRTSFSFVPALLLSTAPPLVLPSSISLSYFILAVPTRECSGILSHFL